MSTIRLSERHGVNPSVEKCYYCGESHGVVLFGRMKNDAQAPREVVISKEPCPKCKERMQVGVILIGIDESKSKPNEEPWRTGEYIVVSEDFVRREITPPELAISILKRRVAFTSQEVCKGLLAAEAARKAATGEA